MAAVDALQSALGAAERAALSERPEAELAETSLIMAAAAIANRTGDAGEAEQFVSAARHSLGVAGFGPDGSSRAGQKDQRQLGMGRLVAAVTDLVDASTAGDQLRVEDARSRALPQVINASRHMSIAEWLPLAQRAMLVPGAMPGVASGAAENKTDVLLAYAEDALVRSYEVADADEQKTLVEIVTSFLYAADPFAGPSTAAAKVRLPWWERDSGSQARQLAQRPGEPVTATPGGGLSPPDAIALNRAQRVAAFASLGDRLADGLAIGSSGLKAASESVAAGCALLPGSEVWRWVRLLIQASTAEADRPPPVGVLTRPDHSPGELFPVIRGEWQRIGVPFNLFATGYMLWVEDWVEPLCAHGLIPGIVVSHDGTPEANTVLSEVLARPQRSGGLVRSGAVVVASTTDDPGVVRKVSSGGGVFYPVRDTREGLVQAVSRAVNQAVGITSERFDIAKLAVSAYRRIVAVLKRHRGEWEVDVPPAGPPSLEPSYLSGGSGGHRVDLARERPLHGDFQIEKATPLSPAHLTVRLGTAHAGITVALRLWPGGGDEHLLETAVLDENGSGTLRLQAADSSLEVVLIEGPGSR